MEHPMDQTFEIYVHDTRYAVPTLVLISAGTERRAWARARELLLESPFHTHVEIDCDGVRLFTIERDAALAGQGVDAQASQRALTPSLR
jgi:hypothetical protein